MNKIGEMEVDFPTRYDDIMERVNGIDPIKYGSSRNYINGSVSYLSPYISRGVISTKWVLSQILKNGDDTFKMGKFIQELAWRDYWQQVWIAKGSQINEDLKHMQAPVSNQGVSKALVQGKTGVLAIDQAIDRFYKTGYIHNHVRMYIAFLACNVFHSKWVHPAKWMYYHLLDADWASNALSWQWVAGANANKKYVANQENINKYCFTDQRNTFLDVPYEKIHELAVPEILQETILLNLKTNLPTGQALTVQPALPTFIYNLYNLDPNWKKTEPANRVLLLEPSHFEQHPVSDKTIDFVLALAKDNIKGIQVYVGEFAQLKQKYGLQNIYFKEHPFNKAYQGIEEPRDWMFNVTGYYPSFFAYWKKCKKELYG